MVLSDLSIRRPIVTVMLMTALLLFGVLGYVALPLNLFPKIDFPVVTVTTVLPGAAPEVVETDITENIERELNAIEGIKSITSVSATGASLITVTFELERDVDVAAQDVRDKVAVAVGNLPEDAEVPVVQKFDPSTQPMLWIALWGMPPQPLSDYTDYVIKPRLQSLPGVGNIFMGGFMERQIRIWLDRDRLEAHDLTATEVARAVGAQNVEYPGGRLESREQEYVVRNMGELATAAEMRRLIVAYRNGGPVRLEDIGRVEDATADPRSIGRYNLRPSMGLGVAPRSGANLVEVSDRVLAEMERLRQNFPPGVEYRVAFDAATFVRASIGHVRYELAYGAILATIVVFVFLRSWRSTLIVAMAIPTSIITAFGFMRLFGFSLNNLTTLALALAVGVVIDDAIVVLENVYRHAEEGESPVEAARKGTSEIAFAAIAATLSIAAVFIPVAYTRGMIGKFLFEFGITTAAAILTSLLVALTLTPMMCAQILRVRRKHGTVYQALERAFAWLERTYSRHLDWALGHKFLTLVAATVLFVASVLPVALGWLGSEFAPPEDMSMFMARLEAPVGTALPQMNQFLQETERIVLEQPEVAGVFAGIGIGEATGGVNEGFLFIRLRPPKERERTQQEVVGDLRRELAAVQGYRAQVIEFSMYGFGGEGADYGLAYTLAGPDLAELKRVSDRIAQRLAATEGIVDVDTNLDLDQPQVHVRVDRARLAEYGLTAADVYDVVQTLLTAREVSKFTADGRRYDVRVKVLPEQARSFRDVSAMAVRTGTGELVRLENLATVQPAVGPAAINRRDRERSVLVTANLSQGMTLDRAVTALEQIVDEELPAGYVAYPAGQAEEFQESGKSLLFALVLAVIIVYMVLASQFNSLLHPFTIMLALPLAIVGALGGLLLAGKTLNFLSMIGIILLMGLVTKNSILLIDFTNVLRGRGLSRDEALRRACPIRLRPILMTSFSMIFGVLPVALALGEGGEARSPMAVATMGGMITSTLLTLLVVPVVYTILDQLHEKVAAALGHRHGEAGPAETHPEA